MIKSLEALVTVDEILFHYDRSCIDCGILSCLAFEFSDITTFLRTRYRPGRDANDMAGEEVFGSSYIRISNVGLAIPTVEEAFCCRYKEKLIGSSVNRQLLSQDIERQTYMLSGRTAL